MLCQQGDLIRAAGHARAYQPANTLCWMPHMRLGAAPLLCRPVLAHCASSGVGEGADGGGLGQVWAPLLASTAIAEPALLRQRCWVLHAAHMRCAKRLLVRPRVPHGEFAPFVAGVHNRLHWPTVVYRVAPEVSSRAPKRASTACGKSAVPPRGCACEGARAIGLRVAISCQEIFWLVCAACALLPSPQAALLGERARFLVPHTVFLFALGKAQRQHPSWPRRSFSALGFLGYCIYEY